jgi:site-specific recombinase XerC
MLESQITASGFTWSAVTADTLRKFVERDASARKGFGAHGTATSVRSFLRFLVSNGLIASGLELAIPQIRRNVVDNLAQMLISLK